MDITFKADYNFFVLILITAVSVFISYFYYKKSKLEPGKKKFFTVLRAFSLFFLLLLILSPVISLISGIQRDPVNVILIDNSQSLLLENRSVKLKEILKEKSIDKDNAGSVNRYFLFSGNLISEVSKDEINEIEYSERNNFQTNLSATFKSLEDLFLNKNLSSVTVISDGIINEGGNPIYMVKSLNVPVSYILTGDTIQKKDLVLKKLYYNSTSFIESKVPIKAEISTYNFDKKIKINLYEENRLIDSKELDVNPGRMDYYADFFVSSDNETVRKYKIEISGSDDEVTLRNNSEEFFIKFADNKFKVLVISGGPGPDNSFISGEIKKVKNFNPDFLTQKSSREFYEGVYTGKEIYDAYIFIGFPNAVSDPILLNSIREEIIRNNSSLIFFSARNTDYGKLSILEDKLPFKISSYSGVEEVTGISPVLSSDSGFYSNRNLLSEIKSFPDIFKTASVFSADPSSQTILVSGRNSEPAMIIQNTTQDKSVAFLVYGFYKWRLNNKNVNASEVFRYLLTTSVVTISDKDAKSKFRIETSKPVYSKFENIIFKASLNSYEIKGGENIKVNVKGNNFNETVNLIKKDNRNYEALLNIPSDGDYEYTAELLSGNNTEESIYGRFAVGENNNEFKSTRADNSILAALANETSGADFSKSDASEIKDSIKKYNSQSSDVIRSLNNFELNINPYYLFILIFLLCLEWFLRKRNNLP